MAHPGAILTVSSYSAPTAPVSLAPGRDAFARPPGASFFTVFVKELKKTRTSCIIETEYAAKGMSVTEYGSGSPPSVFRNEKTGRGDRLVRFLNGYGQYFFDRSERSVSLIASTALSERLNTT